ncbi:MAG: hypothetical protein IPK80_27750 [Nannocystis sp.]|nr:hypothetical protein [Nannocystis sp.]
MRHPHGPLYICRSCGVHAYRMASPEPGKDLLEPFAAHHDPDHEWMLYDRTLWEADDDSAELALHDPEAQGARLGRRLRGAEATISAVPTTPRPRVVHRQRAAGPPPARRTTGTAPAAASGSRAGNPALT